MISEFFDFEQLGQSLSKIYSNIKNVDLISSKEIRLVSDCKGCIELFDSNSVVSSNSVKLFPIKTLFIKDILIGKILSSGLDIKLVFNIKKQGVFDYSLLKNVIYSCEWTFCF